MSANTESKNARKTAIVTGAAQGLGRAIATRLAADGFNISLNDLPSNQSQLEELASVITKSHSSKGPSEGPFAHIIVGDVSDSVTVQKIVNETVSTFGSLDVVSGNLSYVCTSLNSTLRWSRMPDTCACSRFRIVRTTV